MSEVELTENEKDAIRRLKRVAKDWPKTLTLFSWSGTLTVLKLPPSHFDPVSSYVVAYVEGIPNDGGDPN